MAKDVDNLIKFLDENSAKLFDALKSTDSVNYNRVMDQVFTDFLNLDLNTERKARAPKRKVRRGIGSY